MSSDRCVDCSRKVTSRQHALQCDVCQLWQHRICNTGITQTEYRQMIRDGTINFECTKCREETMGGPVDSTHITDQPTPELGHFSLSAISTETDLNSTYVVQRSPLRSPSPPPRSPSPPPALSPRNLTASFDVTRLPNEEPSEVQENSIIEPDLPDTIIPDQPVSYTVVEQGSQRGQLKLVSSDGYTFVKKKMGKLKRPRKKLHSEAVKTKKAESKVEIVDMMDTDVTDIRQPELRLDNPFANLDLDLGHLKQKLPDFDVRSQITSNSFRGVNMKKKDKKKLRHDVFLKKLNAVEAAKKAEKEKKKREKTVIVGDIGVLGDALPTIDLLMKQSSHISKDDGDQKKKGIAKEKKRKKQMLEDISTFQQILMHPSYKENPYQTITTHLRNKLKQEEEMG